MRQRWSVLDDHDTLSGNGFRLIHKNLQIGLDHFGGLIVRVNSCTNSGKRLSSSISDFVDHNNIGRTQIDFTWIVPNFVTRARASTTTMLTVGRTNEKSLLPPSHRMMSAGDARSGRSSPGQGKAGRSGGIARGAETNVRGAFAPRAAAGVALVDDVYTTGATVAAAASALRRRGRAARRGRHVRPGVARVYGADSQARSPPDEEERRCDFR